MSRYDPRPPLYLSTMPREPSRLSTPRSSTPGGSSRLHTPPSSTPHPSAPVIGSISLPRPPYKVYGQGSMRAFSPPNRPRTSAGVRTAENTPRASTRFSLRAVTPLRAAMPAPSHAPTSSALNFPVARLDPLLSTGAELSAGRSWDMRDNPAHAIMTSIHSLLCPATQPAVTQMLISVGPWSFPVTAPGVCVTVRDVIKTLHAFLMAPLTRREWESLGAETRRHVRGNSRRVEALERGPVFAGLWRGRTREGGDVWVVQTTGSTE